jgi:hypothetical protein
MISVLIMSYFCIFQYLYSFSVISLSLLHNTKTSQNFMLLIEWHYLSQDKSITYLVLFIY